MVRKFFYVRVLFTLGFELLTFDTSAEASPIVSGAFIAHQSHISSDRKEGAEPSTISKKDSFLNTKQYIAPAHSLQMGEFGNDEQGLLMKRGAYFPLEEETEDQSSANQLSESDEESEHQEETSWKEKLKSKASEGVREMWKRAKDVTGATIANVLAGRIIEHLDLIKPISGRFEKLHVKKDIEFKESSGQRYNFFFTQNNLMTNN